jgi:hypothetical protein
MEPTDTPKEEQKLDSGLRALYRVWREDPERAAEDGGSVLLLFQGDLGAIEALGFETHSVFGDQALGVIRFKDIPAISALANVLWIAAGRGPKRYLDTAVHDVRARASAPVTGAPVDGLWHADITNPVLTSVSKGTGKGVIIAIIDTGIDFTHPMFMSQLLPTIKTRILKIWDQGLTPASVSDCPDRKFLASADTYGVEYDSTKIEAHLNVVVNFTCCNEDTFACFLARQRADEVLNFRPADAGLPSLRLNIDYIKAQSVFVNYAIYAFIPGLLSHSGGFVS